jgi:NAD(P)-dependent dehydrogenase (short-subunit alcohol dehydrogenase family)
MNVLIVGSSRGIGKELVLKYHSRGAQVWATIRGDIQQEFHPQIKVIPHIDVSNDQSIEVLKKTLTESSVKFDLVIHNAGILIADDFDSLNFDDIRLQFEINTLAPLRVIKALLPFLSSHAQIGLVTSMMGSIGDNASGSYYGYRLSKAAANQLGKTLAMDFKKSEKTKNIKVIIIHPGYVKTDMTGGNGHITPQESANAIYDMMTKNHKSGTFWHANGEEILW